MDCLTVAATFGMTRTRGIPAPKSCVIWSRVRPAARDATHTSGRPTTTEPISLMTVRWSFGLTARTTTSTWRAKETFEDAAAAPNSSARSQALAGVRLEKTNVAGSTPDATAPRAMACAMAPVPINPMRMSFSLRVLVTCQAAYPCFAFSWCSGRTVRRGRGWMALSNNLTPASSRKTTKNAPLRLRASRFDRYHTCTPGTPAPCPPGRTRQPRDFYPQGNTPHRGYPQGSVCGVTSPMPWA